MPTANRQRFINFSIENFLHQDYPNAELIIVDDGVKSCIHLIPDNPKIFYEYTAPLGTIGIKRNIACKKANGEIIMHWDDDDWYAPDWISRQVANLNASDADITGLNKVTFHRYSSDRFLVYEDEDEDHPWLCGATMAYKKSLWQQYQFANLQVGEDTDFLMNSGGKIFPLDYPNGFIGGLHADNVSIKHLENMNTVTWTNEKEL